jgi:electron-transferring-flavoprotein dehydrogenase
MFGTLFSGLDMWLNTILPGIGLGYTLKHSKPDHATLKPARKQRPIVYPKPDNVLTFDRLTNVSFSGTNHEENQPVHLQVADPGLQKRSEHDIYAGPSTRYCKTCDIKDPNQNIKWTAPAGGGGPNYPGM